MVCRSTEWWKSASVSRSELESGNSGVRRRDNAVYLVACFCFSSSSCLSFLFFFGVESERVCLVVRGV